MSLLPSPAPRLAAVVVLLASPLLAAPPSFELEPQLPREVADPARFRGPGLIVGDGQPGLIALTFDDGPKAETTPGILAELARQGVTATFFVNADRLGGRREGGLRQRALLQQAVAAGHTIGNHTLSHQRLSDLPPTAQEREIVDGEVGIAKVIGERPYLFRPPFGRLAPAASAILRRRGYTTVLWNISSEDPFIRQADQVVAQVMTELRREGGGVVLFHDTHPWTVEALPRFFAALQEENCRRVQRREAPLLVVPLDRFLRSRYSVRSASAATALADADEATRRRIAASCNDGRGPESTEAHLAPGPRVDVNKATLR